MKRVKILLTGLAVVTAIGAGLAFKAQKFAGVKLWTSTAQNQCRFVTGITTIPSSTTLPVYFTTTGIENPAVTTACTSTAYTLSVPND